MVQCCVLTFQREGIPFVSYIYRCLLVWTFWNIQVPNAYNAFSVFRLQRAFLLLRHFESSNVGHLMNGEPEKWIVEKRTHTWLYISEKYIHLLSLFSLNLYVFLVSNVSFSPLLSWGPPVLPHHWASMHRWSCCYHLCPSHGRWHGLYYPSLGHPSPSLPPTAILNPQIPLHPPARWTCVCLCLYVCTLGTSFVYRGCVFNTFCACL